MLLTWQQGRHREGCDLAPPRLVLEREQVPTAPSAAGALNSPPREHTSEKHGGRHTPLLAPSLHPGLNRPGTRIEPALTGPFDPDRSTQCPPRPSRGTGRRRPVRGTSATQRATFTGTCRTPAASVSLANSDSSSVNKGRKCETVRTGSQSYRSDCSRVLVSPSRTVTQPPGRVVPSPRTRPSCR